ncbi:glycosyltransferase family 4 protein [Lederbergia ruris]|uniref:glycosyltransferase family 4 protein n=1 Tax=Lederbergia ruris TaxID=217495 RepID=UPI0039A1DB8D
MTSKVETRRISFLIGSMRRGGAERVISILANNYAADGWNVDILTLLDDSNEYELNKNINLIPLGNSSKSRVTQLPAWIKSIRSYVIKNRPDRIVSFIARINIITLFSCLGLNQRIVVSERNDPKVDGRSKIVEFATYLLYPLADTVIFQTKWARSCFPKNIQRNSLVIPNPIQIKSKASNIKNKKIVAVGRLTEQKNHSMLIRAFKRVHEDYPDYKLCIYGDGKLRSLLEEQIQELDLVKVVSLPGNVPNIHEEISNSEIFVLPSNYEGLSNALLEAMMMGLPCVSTNCAGSNEVIVNENNGMLVPVGDEESLYFAITRLIKQTNFRKKIAHEASVTAAQFEKEAVVKMWKEVIEKNA